LDVVAMQQEREFRFLTMGQLTELDLPLNFSVSKPSPYTQNVVGYMERPSDGIRVYQHGVSTIMADAQAAYERGKIMQEHIGVKDMLMPIDHLATRVYSQNREAALLEYLALSSYYYWGSYDIKDQNSSTNVTKNVRGDPESMSPAKVFTANNLPYCVNHLDKLPSPTESFVRNYGPRLHHMALTVIDGQTNGMENIDFVVSAIASQGKRFLLDTVGSREEGLKQIFSSASDFSSLIIEYVQRFDGFQGFFARDNVAHLTFAAGLEEGVQAKSTE
jgi:4-hydroxyphenylpyruvate dioxygenase-like putative hemolysin